MQDVQGISKSFLIIPFETINTELVSEEMNKQMPTHCERCHSVTKSNTFVWAEDTKGNPIIVYLPPNTCPVCRSPNYTPQTVVEEELPKLGEKDTLLCRCQFKGCGKEFINRRSWYNRQQELSESPQGSPWMPIKIED